MKLLGNKNKPKSKIESTSQYLSSEFPHCIFLYGKGGVGKTSLAARLAKRVKFIRPRHDRGVEVLNYAGSIPSPVEIKRVDNWEQTLKEVKASQKANIDLLCLDSATGFEAYAFEHSVDRDFKGNWTEQNKGFYSYGAGPKKVAKRDWRDLLDELSVVLENNIHVVFIGHRSRTRVADPKNPDYDSWQPLLDKSIWEVTFGWAENVFYMEEDFRVETVDGSMTKKAQESNGRWLYTSGEPAYDAKTQLPLPEMIDMGDSADEGAKALLSAFENCRS